MVFEKMTANQQTMQVKQMPALLSEQKLIKRIENQV